MTRAIWKHFLSISSRPQVVQMPHGARIIHVAMQHDRVAMWTEVEPEMPLRKRWFSVLATGEFFDHNGWHVGTVITDGGHFVWHAYELPTPREDAR